MEWDGGVYLLGMGQVYGFSLWSEGAFETVGNLSVLYEDK